MWRPKNWDEITVDVPSHSEPVRIGSLDAECGGLLEAGADAMLGALKESSLAFYFGKIKAGRMDSIDYWNKDMSIKAHSLKDGWLVFIPDKA